MDVYVLLYWAEDGPIILGVYSSAEKASDALSSRLHFLGIDEHQTHNYEIQCHTLDSQQNPKSSPRSA